MILKIPFLTRFRPGPPNPRPEPQPRPKLRTPRIKRVSQYSYKFEKGAFDGVMIRVYRDLGDREFVRDLYVERQRVRFRSSGPEPVEDMFRRAHKIAQDFIREQEEVDRLMEEHNASVSDTGSGSARDEAGGSSS